jgi:hypothetical protein
MPRNYKTRDVCYVAISLGSTTINYGFPSGLDDARRSDFGQTVLTTALPSNFCFGVNAPKPSRASRRFSTGYISSFCADDKVRTLKAAGYRTTRKKIRGVITSGLSRTVYVTIGGIKYAWNRPNFVGAAPASYSQLGVQEATATDTDLIFGATYPKPPRYAFEQEIGGEINVISSFVDPSNAEAATGGGWQLIKPASYYPF